MTRLTKIQENHITVKVAVHSFPDTQNSKYWFVHEDYTLKKQNFIWTKEKLPKL